MKINDNKKLEQQVKQQKEVIDKAIDYIENLVFWYEEYDDICSLEDKFVNELLDILKGKEVSE